MKQQYDKHCEILAGTTMLHAIWFGSGGTNEGGEKQHTATTPNQEKVPPAQALFCISSSSN